MDRIKQSDIKVALQAARARTGLDLEIIDTGGRYGRIHVNGSARRIGIDGDARTIWTQLQAISDIGAEMKAGA